MKINVSSSVLATALQVVNKVILKKNSLAILDNFLLHQNSNGEFIITGNSGGEHQLSIKVDGMSVLEGDFFPVCINASQMASALAALPDQPVTLLIEQRDMQVRLNYQNGQFDFPAYNANEFPLMEVMDDKDVITDFTVDASQFLGPVGAAATCADHNEIRPIMNCVAIDTSNDGYTIASSDGHRLFRESFTPGAPFLSAGKPALLALPGHLVGVLAHAFRNDEQLRLRFDGRKILFTSDHAHFIVTTVEGNYPNYNAAIPTDNRYQVKVNVKAFVAAMKRVALFTSQSSNLLELSADNGGLHLHTEDLDFNTKGDETLAVEDTSLPEKFRIGVQVQYMLSLMSLVHSENIVMHFQDSSRAIVIREDDPQSSLLLLIMPLLIND